MLFVFDVFWILSCSVFFEITVLGFVLLCLGSPRRRYALRFVAAVLCWVCASVCLHNA